MEKWLDAETIAIWILIVLAVITILAVSFIKLVRINFRRMVENRLKESRMQIEHQKNLLETGIVAQEQERTRIAADLHDSLIGKLTVLRLKNQTNYSANEIDLLLGESIAEARRISHDLSPPMLEFIGIEELIENLLKPWKEKWNIGFYKNINYDKDLPENLKIQILRITQELIINTHKYANAENVFVHLRLSPKWLSLCFIDNGKGFDATGTKKGIGLKNIELRMLYLKGFHKIKSGPGKGTKAIITLNHSNFSHE